MPHSSDRRLKRDLDIIALLASCEAAPEGAAVEGRKGCDWRGSGARHQRQAGLPRVVCRAHVHVFTRVEGTHCHQAGCCGGADRDGQNVGLGAARVGLAGNGRRVGQVLGDLRRHPRVGELHPGILRRGSRVGALHHQHELVAAARCKPGGQVGWGLPVEQVQRQQLHWPGLQAGHPVLHARERLRRGAERLDGDAQADQQLLGDDPHIVDLLVVDGDVIDREAGAFRHLEHRLQDLVGTVGSRPGRTTRDAPVLAHVLALRALPGAEIGGLLQVQANGVGQRQSVVHRRGIGHETDVRIRVAIVLPVLRAADQRLGVLAAAHRAQDGGGSGQVHLGAEGIGAGGQVHRTAELAGHTGRSGVPFVDGVIGRLAGGGVDDRVTGLAGRAVGGVAKVQVFELHVRVDVVAVQAQYCVRVDTPHGQEVRGVFAGEGDLAHVAVGIAHDRPLAVLVEPAPWAGRRERRVLAVPVDARAALGRQLQHGTLFVGVVEGVMPR